MPAFFWAFGDSSKIKQSEAKQYIGSMNRAQQAYFLEEGNFTDNIGELGLGISTETKNYTYSIHATILSSIHYSVSRKADLKSYVGGVFLGDAEETGELTTFAILCETKDKGTNRPPSPIVEDGMVQCAPGTESVDGENDRGIFLGEDWELVDVSANYAKAGEYTQALDTVETITEEGFKAKALQVIATELVAAGKPNQALRVTHSITDDSIKSKTIDAIAPYLTTATEYEQAVDVAETITNKLVKAKTLAVIAMELAAASGYDQALPIIEKVQAIALQLTDAGDYTQALRVTYNIPHDSIQSKTIQAIAPYLTTATEHEQAIQVAKTITDYQQKAKALDAIVRRLVATGNDERAVQIAQTIQSYYGGKEKAMAAIEGYKR
ncbi:type IV pilin-like G/H family protein [Coleofasciculus chthonoplastes]|nr:type IV pilin-like G/H family protein [Coleofasciculus chthonoplastes]